jgi:hypothetical protein
VEQAALWSSVTWVRDLVLERPERISSLVMELIENRIDTTIANGVR